MELNRENIRKILLIIFASIAFYYLLNDFSAVTGVLFTLLDLVFPFILGLSIAFIINVPMSRIEANLFKKTDFKGKRAVSLVITLVLFVAVIVGVLFLVIPQLTDTIKALINQIPIAYEKFIIWLKTTPIETDILDKYQKEIENVWENVSGTVIGALKTSTTYILNTGASVVSGVVSGVVNFIIAFIFSIYMLTQKERLAGQIKRIMKVTVKEEKADKILKIAKISNNTFANFVMGQCLEACILGTMFVVTMTVFQLPYALLIGVLIAITALIPIVGAFIGCVVGVILIIMVSPMKALFFIILFLVLQQIEGNLVYPKVVGNSVGLPSIWVLVAVSVGSKLMGVVGMILFIPVFSVIYSMIKEYVVAKEAADIQNEEPQEEKQADESEEKKENEE